MAGKNSMDDFIVQLGWNDKKALTGLKNFMKKVKATNVTVNPKINAQKAISQNKRIVKSKSQEEANFAKLKEGYRKQELAQEKLRHSRNQARIKQELDQKKEAEREYQKLREYYKRQELIQSKKNIQERSRAERAAERKRVINQEVKNFSNSPTMRAIHGNNPELATQSVKRYHELFSKGSASAKKEIKGLNQELRRQAQIIKRVERESMKLNATQRGLRDSTNHLIRSYASVFAILGATTHINRVGQDFESLNSAMLAAMGSQEEATRQIQFLDSMTDRLGLTLLDTADQYTKFTFAAKGKLPTEEVNMLFEGMSELGTTLGISKERMKLSFTAIQQMMNKSTISSEELKRQLNQ